MTCISKWCLFCGKDYQGFDKKNWWRMVRKDELGNFWVGQPSTGTLLIKGKVVIRSSEEIILVRNILDDPDQQVFFEPSLLPRQSQVSEAELVQPLSFPSPPPVGYAAKRRRVKGGGTTISTKMTKKQLDFLTWCYERGAKEKGDKLSPIVAASLMKIHGLPLGEIRFSIDKFWKANISPSPTFRECELLDHWKIRPWFSGQKLLLTKK